MQKKQPQTIENPPLAHSLQKWKAERRDDQDAYKLADLIANCFDQMSLPSGPEYLQLLDGEYKHVNMLTSELYGEYFQNWKQIEQQFDMQLKKSEIFGSKMAISVFPLMIEHITAKDEDLHQQLLRFRQFLVENLHADIEMATSVEANAENTNPEAPVKRGMLAKQEEAAGIIRFVPVSNRPSEQSPGVFKTDPQSLIILTGLKNLYQKQLPKMPKEYIARLVFDRNHESIAIVKRPLKVVGGITFRIFNAPPYPEPYSERSKKESHEEFMQKNRGFGEIVFCAITSNEQVKGYGSHLMNHVKSWVRRTYGIFHFLTYADNYAVGYFKKQGFTADVTLDRSVWAGFIKDYEGGTIMQCTMIPRIEYLEVGDVLSAQKAAVLEKIKEVSQDQRTLMPGIGAFKAGVTELDPFAVPGLVESGWNPGMEAEAEEANPIAPLLRQLLSDLQSQSIAWPFMEPVDAEVVTNYYDVIKQPMDLKTMEHRLDHNYYKSLNQFVSDVELIIENCKQFNDPKSVYVKCANKLEAIFKARLAEVEQVKMSS